MLNIKVRGKSDVLRNIKIAKKLIEYRADRGVERIAETAQSIMYRGAPVKTGQLKSRIEVWNVSKFSFAPFSYMVVSLVSWSAWQEFGRYAPKEFLPYGKTPGGPDFSKSRYVGANQGSGYMRPGLAEIYNSGMTIFRNEFNK
jgi:hypothetical protein